jgi:hypothetical protein
MSCSKVDQLRPQHHRLSDERQADYPAATVVANSGSHRARHSREVWPMKLVIIEQALVNAHRRQKVYENRKNRIKR